MVPEEVAVVGVDNDEVLCELSDPPLTSVVPDAAGIGYAAAVLLDGLMAGQTPPANPILVAPLGIITRGSSDVLALEDRQLVAGLRFLRGNAFRRIDMSEVAKAAGLSRRALERRFRLEIGRSPKAEVIRLRIERAKELLHETDWPLAEIAEKTGFTHGEYLHAVFTRKTGMTPGVFRKTAPLPESPMGNRVAKP
jgi:LacI family transcriptional regulator